MTLATIGSKLLRLFAQALLACAVFVAVYVVYAHATSVAEARRYASGTEVEDFASETALRGAFEVHEDEGLAHEVSEGRLHVHGRTKMVGGRPSAFELVARPRRLEDARLAFRFRVLKPGAYDVSVGYRAEQTGKGPAYLGYGYRAEAKGGSFGWMGNPLTSLAGAPVVDELPDALEHQRRYVAGDAGAEDTDWHEVRLETSASSHQAFATVDGKPAGGVRSEWVSGLPVRIVLAVQGREPDQDVDVEIEQLAYELRRTQSDLQLTFEDQFNGKLIDPRRWHVMAPDSFWMTATAETTPKGLVLRGAAHQTTAMRPGTVVQSPAFPLSSVDARMKVHIEDLHHAGFFMGIQSTLGGALLRTFDAGVLAETGDLPRLRGFAAGHWKKNGQSSIATAKREAGRDVTLVMHYDMATHHGTVDVDGERVVDERIDLQPREDVRFRFGVNVNDGEGRYDVRVTSLELRALED